MTTSEPATAYEITETPVGKMITLPAAGEVFATVDDFMDLVGNASWQEVAWVVLPQERVDDAFFELSTRIAGDVAQKFVNYHVGLAIVGDISRFTEVSGPLRDLVRESNAGRQLWFVRDQGELDAQCARLARAGG